MKENKQNMAPINVLWVIDHVCYDGSLHGGGRLYWNVVPRFDPHRFRIIPCFLRSSEEVRKVFENSPVPVTIFNKGKYDLTTLMQFLRIIKKENIDVMHLHCYASSVFGRLAGWITAVPTIVHDYDTNIYFPYAWYLRIADRFLAPVTNGAIAASPKVRDFLINRRKVDSSKIRMLFHATPDEKYSSINNDELDKAKKQLGINEHDRVIGNITKLGPERGNKSFIKAASKVLESFPDALFLLVYKPTYYHRTPDDYKGISKIHEPETMKAELVDLARDLGIETRIRFIEALDNPDVFTSICDLIVAPFLSDRFSSVNLIEAMAKGKPLIATDVGEQREIIKNEINGYLVTPGDTDELAKTILKVITMPNMLKDMGIQAKNMSNNYSVDAYVKTLQRWYTELAGNRQ